jgi:hypothetical protein
MKKSDSMLSVFDMTKIKWYFEKNDASQACQVLTEQTCTDLNFDEFFLHINAISSCVGQQYMYDRIRRIPHESEMTRYDHTIQYLKDNRKTADRCRKILSVLAHNDAYYICSLFQDNHPVPPSFIRWIIRILQFMPIMFVVIFIVFQQAIWLLFIVVFFLINLAFHYHHKKTQFSYLYSAPQLLKLVAVAGKLSSQAPFDIIQPDIKNRLQSIQSLVRSLSYFRFEVKFDNDIVALMWSIKELVNIFFLIEPNILFRSFQLMEAKRKEIETIFTYTGQIDMLLSVACLQERLPFYSTPQWTETGLHIVDAYHPLIDNCIANTLNTMGKSVLLTGSNMSGKTTFIRTVAINMLSAMTLGLCFARNFSGQRMKIYSAINLHDSLSESHSLYMKEVITVKEMLEESQCHGHHLFVLDEIYKGTNTPERIAASKAVLSALAGNGNMVFASTHDIELADLLSEEYELYHFCEQIQHNRLCFDYLLKAGKLKQRNAIRLLEIEGYPESVIEEAKTVVGTL